MPIQSGRARHPDYDAEPVAFSYLGDIGTAHDDGREVQRIADKSARAVYPCRSPDGRNVDVCVRVGLRDPGSGMQFGFLGFEPGLLRF
jgi:hypothetical protein